MSDEQETEQQKPNPEPEKEIKEENLSKPEAQIEIIQQDDYKDKYLRLLAENENIRKRLQKEKQEILRYTIENTVSEFIPALDNLENALKFADSSSKEVQNWATGFQMILSQFKDILHSHGIVAFHSEGNIFDPYLHEAMEIVETDEQPEGMVIEEMSKGYKSPHRTIRPARVKVSKKPSIEPPQEKEIEPKN